MSEIESLQSEIREAEGKRDEATKAAEQARSDYDAAVKDASMEAARKATDATQSHEADAQAWADRIEALEAKRVEAEAIDGLPAFRQAEQDLEQAISEESKLHDRLESLVSELVELDQAIAQKQPEVERAAKAAASAATAAHQTMPAKPRTMPPNVREQLMTVGRKLGNRRSHVSQTMTQNPHFKRVS